MKNEKGCLKGFLIGLGAFGLALSGLAVGSSIGSEKPITVYASLEDDLQGDVSNNIGNELKNAPISEDDKAVANWIKNQRGMTSDHLNIASRTLSPITNLVGYIIGGALVIMFCGIFVITSLDLVYISIPPLRNFLYKAGTDGTGAYTGGGMAGGYNRGMYGNSMAGAGGASGGSGKPTQWVSDEAVECASLIGGSARSTSMGTNGSGQEYSKKSVITLYFKKRIVVMIMLVITAIVLTSSALLGTGANISQWLLKVISLINNYISVA